MPSIARHRTAMSRTNLSRPLQQAHADGLLSDTGTVLDFGCGRGDDVRTLKALGLNATGWDPAFAPDEKKDPTDLVNIGYVVNVIEDVAERAEALREAWRLAKAVLIVSGRLVWDTDSASGKPFKDGRLTNTGTFQKYYTPEELKAWIEATLSTPAVTAAPGVYYVFREASAAQALLARHSRADGVRRQGIAELLYDQRADLLRPVESYVSDHRRLPAPSDLDDAGELIEAFGSIRSAFSVIRRVTGAPMWSDVQLGSRTKSEQQFEEHLDDLQPLIDFVSDRGRLPRPGELTNEAVLAELFGSVRAAFSVIRRVTGPSRWTAVEDRARENFLVYSALAAFGRRPSFSQLPDDLQYDAKDLFGSYKTACLEADRLLYSIADTAALDKVCREAPFGKLTPEALYVHVSARARLAPLLRVYVGAAETLTGKVDDATVLKLHRLKPQVSFLIYPTFDSEPHPVLQGSLVARLPQLRISYKDFSESDNPPILHRKETFVPSDYPGRAKFDRLTGQEERAELLNGTTIGRRREWNELLGEKGYQLKGHRLVKA